MTTTDTPTFQPEWRDPADAEKPWFRDVMHNPDPVSPISSTLFHPAFSAGATDAVLRLSMPVVTLRAETHHGYVFLTSDPFEGTPEELEARTAEMQRLAVELGATVLEDWRSTFEPRVLAIADEVRAFPYASASVQQTAQHLAKSFDWLREVWDIHMRVNIPAMNSVFGMEEFLSGILGEGVLPAARQLLQGFDNKSVAMGKALWALSRWIRSDAGLAEALTNARLAGGHVDLGTHPARAEFDRRWQAFLDEFGWRSDVFMEMGHPSWREDHTSALTQLRRYAAMDDGDDPFLGHHDQAQRRPGQEAALEAQLPEELRPVFRMLLHGAQQYLPIAEDHNFTIDQKFTMVMREAYLHLGDRLVAAGALDDPEDVFYLEYDEVLALAAGGDAGGLRGAVAERRQRRADQRLMQPPPALGPEPSEQDMMADPLAAKFFGVGVRPSSDPSLVVGHGVSNGTVEGTARVVMSLDDADRLEPGDVLVCPMTMPAWTPFFGIAGAVVCDSGGPLSHCAIVAREYMIPCVAGTVIGTAKIADGQRVRVDGTSGRVTILG